MAAAHIQIKKTRDSTLPEKRAVFQNRSSSCSATIRKSESLYTKGSCCVTNVSNERNSRVSMPYQSNVSQNNRGILQPIADLDISSLTLVPRQGLIQNRSDNKTGFLPLELSSRRTYNLQFADFATNRRVSIDHNSERAEKTWRRAMVKATAVSRFIRSNGKKRSRRDSLVDFIQSMKSQQNESLLVEVLKEYADDSETNKIITKRQRSPVEKALSQAPTIVGRKVSVFKPGIECVLCQQRFLVYNEHDDLPCRVCSNLYHRRCIDKCPGLHPADVKCLPKAKTQEGWSCPKCANLSLLLTQNEIDEMIQCFQDIDTDEDAKLSMDEFLTYHVHKKRLSRTDGGLTLTSSEKALLESEYKGMDQDGDGMVDWWEFINHESLRFLATKHVDELVKLLSQKELSAARAQFDLLDTNKDGRVVATEVHSFFKRRFKPLQDGPHKRMVWSDSDLKLMELYASIGSRVILDATPVDKNGYVTWTDFLCKQTLSILSARPNCYRKKIKM